MANVNEIFRDHVTLTVDWMDHVFPNRYIPNLQVPGTMVNYLINYWGNPIPSPA